MIFDFQTILFFITLFLGLSWLIGKRILKKDSDQVMSYSLNKEKMLSPLMGQSKGTASLVGRSPTICSSYCASKKYHTREMSLPGSNSFSIL